MLPAPAELPRVGSEKFLRCSPLLRSPKLSEASRWVKDAPVDDEEDGCGLDDALTELVEPPSIMPESLLVKELKREKYMLIFALEG